jgi:hypothetical protein
MLLGVAAASLFVLIAPRRFGNLVHESLNLLPEVHADDWGKKLLLRLFGLGLLAFAIRTVLRIVALAN